MDRLANKLTDYCEVKNCIEPDKKEIYCYGFKLIIADLINFTLVIVLGALFNRLVSSVCFLVTLCGIRQFSGGYHSKSFWLCRLSMLITFSAVLGVSSFVAAVPYVWYVILVINLVSVAIIGILSPIRHPNKRLTEKQRKMNKIKSIILSSVLSVVSLVLAHFYLYEGVVVSITILSVTVLMIIGLINLKGGKKNV